MTNTFIENDILLALPLEAIEIEPEDFQEASVNSNKITDEALRWQTYQNALALIGFERWLKQRKPELQVDKSQCSIFQPQSTTTINATYNLKVNDLIVCLINRNDLTEEFIPVTKNTVYSAELAAHFYVLTEVLEEQEQVIINGFVRYDQLNNYLKSGNLQTSQNEYYQLPLSLFESQLNQLLLYLGFLTPNAIPLPVAASSDIPYLEEALGKAGQSIVNLSHWLHGAFDTGWQAAETVLAPSFRTTLAFRFRDARSQKTDATKSSLSGVKRGKLLNLGIEQAGKSLVLIVGFEAVEQNKFQVLVDIYPTTEQTYLPQNLQLMVLDETGKAVMQVQTRNTNKNIYLDFKGNPGERFSIKVILGDTSITEAFVI
ncbi:Protein of unknown function (DUF1822) [Rivularia sp. PCC 7116]|uniref:DUF1822 family protein n=1 Tax=Rivularia sp. PCC 7116 TaxID=373994 RepID=UPI00029EC57A|nr:DUF1822 family protein [Rivularia sp. PCC 7116]AFY57413.1 Protein of unknown function (DUF1822) [Rivularia sp. PCC 7116]